jgi:class 3 adenylate cyclase
MTWPCGVAACELSFPLGLFMPELPARLVRASGRPVNTAARIADYAQPQQVLASEDARQVADADGVEFQLIGDVPLKGVSQSVRLHRVLRR